MSLPHESLGRDLVDALRGGATGEVCVERGGIKARAQVRGAGLYGADLDGLTVETEPRAEADRGARTRAVVHGIAERVGYLAEPLEALELSPEHGRGQLRTRREHVRGGEFYEVDVAGGDRVDVHRVRYDRARQEHHQQPHNAGHGVLRRLVDDLAELIDTAGAGGSD